MPRQSNFDTLNNLPRIRHGKIGRMIDFQICQLRCSWHRTFIVHAGPLDGAGKYIVSRWNFLVWWVLHWQGFPLARGFRSGSEAVLSRVPTRKDIKNLSRGRTKVWTVHLSFSGGVGSSICTIYSTWEFVDADRLIVHTIMPNPGRSTDNFPFILLMVHDSADA